MLCVALLGLSAPARARPGLGVDLRLREPAPPSPLQAQHARGRLEARLQTGERDRPPPEVRQAPLTPPGRRPLPKQVKGCDFSHIPAVVWWGDEPRMSLHRLAAYLAPVFWFSPDEPLLEGREGAGIRIPEAFPFEAEADAPVVYYQLNEILGSGAAYVKDDEAAGGAVIDLTKTQAFSMSYLAYFPTEEGLGAHPHDLEPVEFRAVVLPKDSRPVREKLGVECRKPGYLVAVTRVTGEAHGMIWFYNIVKTDAETRFPMHLLVEEGKHALATDKNGDGYFTPGYDVNARVNDAWGVRDVIRSGMLFTGGFEAWMAKVRRPEHQILPPLPADSPLEARKTAEEKELDLVTYELRRYPPSTEAAGDSHLEHLMAWREVEGWPEEREEGTLKEVVGFLDTGLIVRSLSIALMLDGDLGFSFVFPFFVVKNLEDPVGGGFVVWRIYTSNQARDFGWMAMYAPSASRWIDTYVAAGAEWAYQGAGRGTDLDFVLESGIKFRVNLVTTPFRFLGFLTDFWGLRLGIRNRGFFRIDELTYVIEIGAGTW